MPIDGHMSRALLVGAGLDMGNPQALREGPGMFSVTLVQLPPPSRVTCTKPSSVPTQITLPV